MKYMGSKNRIAKYILPIMLKDRRPDQYWVEPFVGGANIIDKVCGLRIGADSNPYLIKALKLIRDNPESLPDIITEVDYSKAKSVLKVDGLTGFIGFSMSFGGKWFGGYRRDVAGSKGCINNMQTQTRRCKESALKQSPKLQGVCLKISSFENLIIPPNSIVYCDPPYRNTTKYKDSLDYDLFYNWCRAKNQEGHTVFVSEYNMPDDFKCVWIKEICSSLCKNTGSKKGVERLFTL